MSRPNPHKSSRIAGAALAAAVAFAALTGVAHAEDNKPVTQAAQQAAQQPPAAKSWQTGLHRTDLVRQDLGVADREVIQVRVDFEPGVASPKHSHPGVEVAHVISGTFQYQLDGQPTVTLKAGDSLYIPAGTAHVATNIGTTTGSELATYIVEKDAPLVKVEQ
ncbi:cupin domain-containing protein [Pseudomonas sp. NPDC090202]|uniref:cupin domain-containing protein n=1 Tax=unclassified Pseudomonas TaxID=196821 RepID=UPI003823C7C7